jgi:hypothetical protein
MKSITVHGLEDKIYEMIRKRAKSEGRSVNKVVKELIARALGLEGNRTDNTEDFANLCGVWTEEEAREFREVIGVMARVDPEEWQ